MIYQEDPSAVGYGSLRMARMRDAADVLSCRLPLPGRLSIVERHAIRASVLTGLVDDSLVLACGSEFNTAADVSVSTGISGGTVAAGTGGVGVAQVVGGTAGQGIIIHVQDSYGICSNMAGKRWYAMGTFWFNVAPNSNSRIYFQFGNGQQRMCAAGINGTTQTAMMAFGLNTLDSTGQVPKLDILSSVPVVVGQRFTGSFWYDLDRVYGSFNDETPIVLGTASSVICGSSTSFYFHSYPAGNGQNDSPSVNRMYLWVEE